VRWEFWAYAKSIKDVAGSTGSLWHDVRFERIELKPLESDRKRLLVELETEQGRVETLYSASHSVHQIL